MLHILDVFCHNYHVDIIKKFVQAFLYHKYLLLQLTQRDIKARYKQSIIGYAWVILNPLSQLLVYSFVFSVIIRFPTEGVAYPVFLFIGLIPWVYLQNSLSSVSLSLVENSDLLKKIYFPREVFPYSVIMSKLVDFIVSFVILFGFLFFYHVQISWVTLYFFPLLFVQIILMTGLALFFSSLNLFYRDIRYLVNLILLLWMYLTPILYPLSMVPKDYLWIYKLNPMVGIIEGYRSAFFNLAFDVPTIALSTIISLIIFISGFIFFKKTEGLFADIV